MDKSYNFKFFTLGGKLWKQLQLNAVMILANYAIILILTVGDTYPIAAPFAASNVFYANAYYTECPDCKHYNTQNDSLFGNYPRNCGFDKVDMTWGHDEYIYEAMKQGSNTTTLEL